MTDTKAKPILRLKDPKRFLINKENQDSQQRIFDTFVVVEEWTRERLIDEVFLSLMSVKVQFCMMDGVNKEVRASDSKNHGRGVIRRLYEEQARYKMRMMAIYRPPPIFVIHLKDLDDKVKQELLKDDPISIDYTLKEAVGRICEQVDNRFYLLSAKQFLKVRLEK